MTASERALAQGLAEQRGHPVVVLAESAIDLGALELVPRSIAEQHEILALAVDTETITIAVSDAGPRPIFDQIEFATGRRVHALLAIEAVLADAIADAYDALRAGHTTWPVAPAKLVVVRPAPIEVDASVSSAPRADAPRLEPEPQKPTVLVVDDDDDIRTLLVRMMAYDGYATVEARTGREAMTILRTQKPSAILLDAMLPEIHGFDICATLKRSAVFRDVPVVIISAVYKGWEHAKLAQEAHGADAFVEKPFDVNYVRQLVARMVGKTLPKNPLTAEWQKKIAALREEAEVHYNLGDFESCDEVVKQWRALDPFDAHPLLLSGNARFKLGDLEGAMKAYERAAAFDGALFPAFKNLASVYERLGFQQRAAMAWYRAYELAPDAENRRRIEEHLNAREHVGQNRTATQS